MAIISCPNCGNSISSESINCIHCGDALNPMPAEGSQQSNGKKLPSNAGSSASGFGKEFTQFYSGDFKRLFKTFFTNPIDGIRSIFTKNDDASQKTSIILFVSVFIFYIVGFYFLAGDGRSYLTASVFMKIGLLPILLMLIISVLSFVIKSISGTANFKHELLTGAICGIPLGLLIIAMFIIKLFADKDLYRLMSNASDIGVVGVLILLYILLMLINVFQQSLKASGTKDGASWYLSPIAILLSLYLSYQMATNMF